MSRVAMLLIGSVGFLAGAIVLLNRPNQTKSSSTIMLYCAASNRAVMEEIREAYEEETGHRIEIQYGPSQTLLSSIEVAERGELFLPADDSYLDFAKEKSLIEERIPIARMQAGIAVAKGNPKGIHGLDDLGRGDVRLVMANPETAAIGKVAKKTLASVDAWEPLERANIGYRATVNEVANDIMLGAADAGIVYDAVLHTYPDLEFVSIDELAPAASDIMVGVIASTEQPQAALHFARYLSASDRGLKHYADHGFGVVAGDEWDDQPELSIFAGSMLRPAIEETIAAFERREGITVHRVYNGCGILVAQMKAGQHPDAYFACDQEFMNQVHDLFPEPV
ncbi:MAG: molybdate ABC transporter substrate-binding protein, partial [Planctomycetota bacterium]